MAETVTAREFLESFDETGYPEVLNSRYEILERLSHGAMGETLLVLRKSDGKRFICKVYPLAQNPGARAEDQILRSLQHEGLPRFEESFEADGSLYVVREYIEGPTLAELAGRGALTEAQIIAAGIRLCDILSYLHGHTPPVIHRDIKPSNVIIDGEKVFLIDFGIARIFEEGAGTDTVLLGTQDYAPPEQYGFAQTDSRSDIYSMGVLLRAALTGNVKGKIKNRRLSRVAERCTALDPSRRYKDAAEVKKALLLAEPKRYWRRVALIALPVAALVIAGSLFGLHAYREAHKPIDWSNHTPAFLSSGDVISDSVSYLNERYKTDFFTGSDEVADIGYVKSVLTGVYGMDSEYINALPNEPDGIPRENANNFLPWGLGDAEKIPREILAYVVVKAYWPDVVADWSSLTDDTGMYPGVRVAMAFADEHGIFDDMNKYGDITQGEVAIVFCKADRVFGELSGS